MRARRCAGKRPHVVNSRGTKFATRSLEPARTGEEDAIAMNINYDLEFDLDGFLSDLEKRQSNQKRSRLEERKKESRRIRHEIERHGEKARH
jgi:hypothetical protein